MQSHSFDVLVVGGGIAGLVAANRAAEFGLKVAVVEKGQEELYLCNSRYTGGFFHVGMQDIRGGPEHLQAIIKSVTREETLSPLAAALAADAGRGIQWMQNQGIRFIKAGPEGYKSAVLAPPGLRQTGLHWQGRGGDVMLRTLEALLVERRGGKLFRGTRATRLVMRDGCCVGLEVEGALSGVVEARSVVLADGGFQADMERMRQEVSPLPERLLQRGAATGTGDGARMAEAVGARLVRLDTFYGHVLHIGALRNEALWPYPVLDMIAAAGILVDAAGNRFCDEGEGGIYQANAIAKLADPASATVIFDAAIWEGPGREFLLPANPHLPRAGGEIVEADTIAGLEAKLGIDAARLQNTVDEYNAACAVGGTARLNPARRADRYRPMPIAKPAFMAARVCAGVTYTLGGVAIDADARALDNDDQPVPGLFAVGSTSGGLEGGPHAGYTGGLSKALVTGLRAAECIAGQLGRTAAHVA